MARRLPSEIQVRDHGVLAAHPIDGLLRGLAAVDARPAQVVSMTLDARWDSEHKREHARLALKNALGAARAHVESLPPELGAALERDLARADEYAAVVVKQRLDVGFEGIAAFYCEPRRLDLVMLSHAAMPTALVVGPRPAIVPLARAAHELDLALVAVVETDETRIFELVLGGATAAETIVGDVPPRVGGGGWRQLRIQKHIADHRLHHHRQAARDLAARFDGVAAARGRPPRGVLGGREPALAAFERGLPERVLAQAIQAAGVAPQAPEGEVLGPVRAALAQAIAQAEQAAVAAVREATAGRGALGLPAVLEATHEGRLRELLVSDRFDRGGIRCTRCDRLDDRPAARCPRCAGDVEPVALLDELVRHAVLAQATVRTLHDPALLAHEDGVAALLR